MPHGHLGTFPERSAGELYLDPTAAFQPATHARHLLKAPAQDPHVIFHDGLYHYCESSPLGIFVRSARHFLELGTAESRCVWTPPAQGPASRNVWAPELHRIDDRFHIYFAADNGDNAQHRMWVLSATSEDPAGTYELAGSVETGGWAIDGTILTDPFGNHIFVWSGWPAGTKTQQNLYMARMKSPLELSGSRVLLTQPDRRWETRAMAICEGPQVIQRGSRTCIVYSASGSWTQDYCLGMLVHEGGDLLDPLAWRKVADPVFKKNGHACGVGHCCFVTTPDGMEDWMIYHAKTARRRGWADREVRAQAFSWNADQTPLFGCPLPSDRDLVHVVATPPLAAQSA